MEYIRDKKGLCTEIKISWCYEDVLQRAKENGIRLTKKEACDALALTLKRHDCNIGISWETLDVWIDEIVSERGERN